MNEKDELEYRPPILNRSKVDMTACSGRPSGSSFLTSLLTSRSPLRSGRGFNVDRLGVVWEKPRVC